MADVRRIPKSVMLIVNQTNLCYMFKAEVPSEEKISQPEYEVCDDYFLLRKIDFLQFSKDLQYSMSYV